MTPNKIEQQRGALWRKWDLHVHSPASANFSGDWPSFVIQLGSSDCAVIGINDYFSVAGYRQLIAKLDDPNELTNGSEAYTLREIEIVRPKMVICLGIGTFNALREVLGSPAVTLDGIDYGVSGITCHESEVHGVPHVGARGLSATGGYVRSAAIWRQLANRLIYLSAR